MGGNRVSVVVTTFNQARYLGETLESVCRQTLTPAEVIVVDDGSTDDTAEVVRRFGTAITYIHQANKGVAGSRNTGVAAVTGDLVALLDGDDLWHPQKLEAQVAGFAQFPEAGIVAVENDMFTADNPPTPNPPRYPHQCFAFECRDRLPDLVERCFLFTTSQVMIPTRVLREVGPSSTDYATSSDFDLYLRIARRWPIATVDLQLCYWRYLASSSSGPAGVRELRWWPELAKALRRHAKSFPPPVAARARRRANEYVADAADRAYRRSTLGNRGEATRYLCKLIGQHPSVAAPWYFLLGVWSPAIVRRLAGKFRSTPRLV